MSSLTFSSTIADDGANELADVFRTQPNDYAYVRAMLVPFQTISDVFQAIYTQRWVLMAVGQQLDNFGTIVGQPRNGENDSDYRTSILAKIGENNSQSTRQNVISIFGILTGCTSVHVIEAYPASMSFTADSNPNGIDPTILLTIMQRCVGAGIRVYAISFTGGTGVFSYFGNPFGKGYSEVGQPAGTGGTYADVAATIPGP